MKNPNRAGFTLIELLIVIVVIGILASIAVPKFNVTKRRAYRSSMLADLKNLANQQELYHNLHYTYTTSLTDMNAVNSEGVTLSVNEADGTGWSATAIHAGITSGQCGIYYGDAAQSGGSPATTPGMVACTDF